MEECVWNGVFPSNRYPPCGHSAHNPAHQAETLLLSALYSIKGIQSNLSGTERSMGDQRLDLSQDWIAGGVIFQPRKSLWTRELARWSSRHVSGSSQQWQISLDPGCLCYPLNKPPYSSGALLGNVSIQELQMWPCACNCGE